MNITLSKGVRTRFRNDVAAHRADAGTTDRDYAEAVLGISLNTLKKVLNAEARSPLVLKQSTFVAICRAASLEPATYDVAIRIPARGTTFGSYERADYDYLEGTYIIHRRSFLTAENIVRGALEIAWDERQRCLAFLERHSYTTDSGAPYETTYRGHLHIRRDRHIIGMVQLQNGEARLTLVNTPDRPQAAAAARARVKARGALLTYGNPRDFYQPIVTAIIIEQLSTNTGGNLSQLCKTLRRGSEEYAQAAAELKHAEDQTVVMTPLMWRKLEG